jgi:hypothetical protein
MNRRRFFGSLVGGAAAAGLLYDEVTGLWVKKSTSLISIPKYKSKHMWHISKYVKDKYPVGLIIENPQVADTAYGPSFAFPGTFEITKYTGKFTKLYAHATVVQWK